MAPNARNASSVKCVGEWGHAVDICKKVGWGTLHETLSTPLQYQIASLRPMNEPTHTDSKHLAVSTLHRGPAQPKHLR